jgi:hypothetical protein
VNDDRDIDHRADERFERAVFWRQMLIAVLVGAVIALRAVYG